MPNPFILASAPPTANAEMIAEGFRHGWGGAVLKTVSYQEKFSANVSPRITACKGKNDILGFTNCELGSPHDFNKLISDVRELKKDWPDRGIFVSMLYAPVLIESQWRELTRKFSDAGADGFELNFSCPHGMADVDGGSSLGSNEAMIEKVASWVVSETKKAVIAKLPAIVTDLPGKAQAAERAKVSAIAAINTLNAIAGVNIKTFVPLPEIGGKSTFQGLSGRAIKPVALRCVAQIAQSVKIPVSGMGGIYDWRDAVEFILLGASSLQVCSAVMEHGYGIIESLCSGLSNYMNEMGFSRVNDFVGLALQNIDKHYNLSRTYKVVAKVAENCTGCGKCRTACNDSGFQAIRLNEKLRAEVNGARCDGCGLCSQICPANCITMNEPEKGGAE